MCDLAFQELETVVGSLLVSEMDRDVSAAVSTTITLLDKIEVCESQVCHVVTHSHSLLQYCLT